MLPAAAVKLPQILPYMHFPVISLAMIEQGVTAGFQQAHGIHGDPLEQLFATFGHKPAVCIQAPPRWAGSWALL